MTPEEMAARTRLEQEAGRNAVRRFASNPAMQEQDMVDFVELRLQRRKSWHSFPSIQM